MTDALEGVTGVEFGSFAAGPGIGKYLANFGARVIHVESAQRPDGLRTHYPPFKDDKAGLNRAGAFAFWNDSKYGVTLNLKHPQGLALAHQLVEKSDFVIENMRPGVMARLGLGYDELRKCNPRLVLLSTSNMGQTGPYADHPGFGSQLSSLSGFSELIGREDGPPLFIYGPYIDLIAVAYGGIAVLAALDHQRRTGEGARIDLSQYEAGLQFVAAPLLDFAANGNVAKRNGNRDPVAVPHGCYPCRDGRWCVISCWNEEEWQQFCYAAGLLALCKDPRFSTASERRVHETELNDLISQCTREEDAEKLMHRLQKSKVHAAVVRSMRELFTDPQIVSRDIWQKQRHREMGEHHYRMGSFQLAETPGRIRKPAPCLGEHNEEIFCDWLGLDPENYRELEKQGRVLVTMLLEPYRVLDATGPLGFLTGKILGDLGADVVKVEPPGGDPSRQWSPQIREGDCLPESLSWLACNINKREIQLDLETDEGRDGFRTLVGDADFVLETFPPGKLEEWDLGYEALRKDNPGLIFVSITPFGQDGPYHDFVASDLEIMALGGVMSLTGDEGGEPMRVTAPASPMWVGVEAAMGALTALLHRTMTGQGQRVDVSAQVAAMAAVAHAPIYWDLNRVNPERSGIFMTGRTLTGARMRVMWPCQDGWINFIIYGGPAGRHTNRELVTWMAERDMAPDWLQKMDWSTFTVPQLTQEKIDKLEAPILSFMATITKHQFYERVMDRGMLGYPVATAKEILQDPQLKERKFWQDVRIPGSERTLRFPGGFAIVNGKRLQVRVPDRAPDEEIEEAERRKRS